MVLAVGTRIDPPECGTSTTLGTAGRAITFATELPDTEYHVSITFEAAASLAGSIGEYRISAKATTGFTLANDGASGITFTYAVTRY
jgi:hypothetical protein